MNRAVGHCMSHTGHVQEGGGGYPKDPAVLETLLVVNRYCDSNSIPR